MNCPICNEVIAFSLAMHMHAAHGPKGPMVNVPPASGKRRTVSNLKKEPRSRPWAKLRKSRPASAKAY